MTALRERPASACIFCGVTLPEAGICGPCVEVRKIQGQVACATCPVHFVNRLEWLAMEMGEAIERSAADLCVTLDRKLARTMHQHLEDAHFEALEAIEGRVLERGEA